MKDIMLDINKINLRQLKWIAILAPVAFLVAFDYVRHFVPWGAFFHSPLGFAGIYVAVLAGVFVFAEMVFRVVQRIQDKVLQQNEELTAVGAIAQSLGLSLSVEQILWDSLDRVMRLVRADAGVICLLDAEKAELFSSAHRGFSQTILERIRRQKLADDPIGSKVVATKSPVIIPRVLEYGDPRIVEMARQEGFSSGMSFPLTSQGKVVGVLALAGRRDGAFDDSTVGLISGIANQVAIAIERACLFDDGARRNRELAALIELSTAVSSSLNVKEVIKTALDKALELLGVEAGEVWLWDEASQEMVMASHSGLFPEAFKEVTRFKMGVGFPGLVAMTGDPIICSDITMEERFIRNSVMKAGIRFYACVPLKAKGKVVGAMDLASKECRQLTPRELQFITSIGNQIGVAIENALLYQRVQSLAVAEERGRIAREIHDGVAQVLAYVNTKTQAVERLLDTGQLDQAKKHLSQLDAAAKEVYADTREAILGLRSTISPREGLLPALEEYFEKFHQMNGIPVSFSVTPKDATPRIDPQAEIQVIRIIQEALSNVRKHSNASQAWVSLEVLDGKIAIVIRDNGCGFDSTQLAPGKWPRFGLRTMQERAESIGGNLTTESCAGAGTKVVVTVPRDTAGEDAHANIAR
ncbi:MAG: GAF domain-containing protein [Chloroflexi bacterium]|nr:GAF domain-containing protein [Chloroflexota bacterium]